MKKLFKITSLVLAGLLFVSLIFGAGIYAANQDWLRFDDEKQIEKSESDVNEIMQILRDVNSKKMTAEEALKELKELNLEGENKELLNQVDELQTANGILNTEVTNQKQKVEELKTANGILNTEVANQKQQVENKQNEVNQKQNEIRQKEQEIQQKIEEGNNKVAEKQAELNVIAGQRDEHKLVAEELEKQINHLRGELERANKAVANHAQSTSTAVEEARKYKVVDQE